MSTLKDIASLFVKIDDEAPSAEQAPAVARAAQVPAAPPPMLRTAAADDPENAGKISEKLTRALEENNLDGIDFFEFRKTLDALQDVIADEPTRYRAAYGSLLAQGAQGTRIIQTASHYLEVLANKSAGFAQHLQDQERQRVLSKQQEAQRYKEQIQEKSNQIARLTQEIGKLAESEVAARNDGALAKAEIDAYARTFQDVKDRFCRDIQTIQEKIQLYIVNQSKA